MFILIAVVTDKVKNAYKVRLFGLIALVGIFFLTFTLESVYKTKSWYGPSFFPPSDYSRGSIAVDQGNNIWKYYYVQIIKWLYINISRLYYYWLLLVNAHFQYLWRVVLIIN